MPATKRILTHTDPKWWSIKQTRELLRLVAGARAAMGQAHGITYLLKLGLALIILYYQRGESWTPEQETQLKKFLEENGI